MPRLATAILATICCWSLCSCGGPSRSDIQRFASRKRDAPPPASSANAEPAAAKTVSKAGEATPAAAKSLPPPAPGLSSAQSPTNPKQLLPTGSGEIRVVVQNEKPKEPLSVAERRARSLANLEKIGRALTAHVAKNGRLPHAIGPNEQKMNLSWRVAILPELGYQQLYDQFDGNEPWNGPRNQQLLAQIPPEFQSAERFDTKTNYLAVAGPGMTMGSAQGSTPEAVALGLDGKLAILEVDDGPAVPWTQPSDWSPDSEFPSSNLGNLRRDGTFALMASGRLVL